MFVNYKGFQNKSRADAPPLDDLLEELYVNASMCFPAKGSDDAEEELPEYVERIVGYLHREMEVSSRSSSSSTSASPKLKRTKRGLVIHGVRFRSRSMSHLDTLKSRWELFVLLNGKHVDASCLVNFNDIYQTCEIHEVCVATSGKGLCKKLMTFVVDHIKSGASGHVREINIYCETNNPAACKCYGTVFQGAFVTRTSQTTAYSLRISKTSPRLK
jgi:hypothetical protein